jgi:hypothetical protein
MDDIVRGNTCKLQQYYFGSHNQFNEYHYYHFINYGSGFYENTKTKTHRHNRNLDFSAGNDTNLQ